MTNLHRSFLVLAALTATGAAAQTSPPRDARLALEASQIPTAVRDAGTFHVATGTWTRRSGQQAAAFGPDIIYSNNTESGYFTAAGGNGDTFPGSVNVDEGLLPIRGDAAYPLAVYGQLPQHRLLRLRCQHDGRMRADLLRGLHSVHVAACAHCDPNLYGPSGERLLEPQH